MMLLWFNDNLFTFFRRPIFHKHIDRDEPVARNISARSRNAPYSQLVYIVTDYGILHHAATFALAFH